jgi:ComF family protein
VTLVVANRPTLSMLQSPVLRAVIDPLVSVLYPQECHVCGEAVESIYDGIACGECWEAATIFHGGETLCAKCGALPAGAEELCRQCSEAAFDHAIAAGIYEGALAATILYLKRVDHLPKRAQSIFENRIKNLEFADETIILPVPLSKQRKFERGFNQAEILASIVSRVTGFPVYSTCLVRRSHAGIYRAAMDRSEREMTVENAFEARAPRLIEGREVVLVDDVLTSGATASACARALKKSGARHIIVVTLARAVR